MRGCHFLVKQFQMGGTICLWYLYPYIYWYFLIFSNKLTVWNGFSLTGMKICCFEWLSLSHSLFEQFQMGGTICLWYLYPYIYWYFLIFSNKLTAFGIYMFSLHWYFLISSYYLTVSNGCSLTALKSIEVTQSSDSFIWGGGGRGGGSSMDTLTNKQSDLKSRSLH